MNKNDIFEIEITGITDQGDGVGRAEGLAVFVPYALVGEKVKAVIIKVLKNYAVGKLLEVTEPSPHRVKAECPYFYKCGGCQYWNADYETELLYKHKQVEDCIRRIAKLDIHAERVIGAQNQRQYRNKGQFPVRSEGIGIYAKHSHRVIDVESCVIQDENNPVVLKCVREWMAEFNIEPYDEETEKGCVRHIYTRWGKGGGVVCIVTNTPELPMGAELAERLCHSLPDLCGVVQNYNNKKTNVVLGSRFKTIWGTDTIMDSIGHCSFRISPQSFYQVNNAQTEVLYSVARDFAGLTGNEIVWDLYCGIGTIGQFMAEKAKKIVGIEVVEQAVENARENARLNGIENTRYYAGTAEGVAPKLNDEKPDVVVLDPPRKGCEGSLLKYVAKLGPKRIVYVSCKPSTLARDLKILDDLGYRTEKLQPVDLFPRTCHIETVALLCKA